MEHEYRICPLCEGEFTLSVNECPDCYVGLVSPSERPEPVAPEAFPEIAELNCVRVGPLPWTRALSEKLGEGAIPHRVEPDRRSESEGGIDPRRFGGEDLYGTWVKSEDLEAARSIDRLLFAPLELEAAPDAQGDEACPACGAVLPVEAMECAECGLSFG